MWKASTTSSLDARFQDPVDASIEWLEVTDPREPLYGQCFQIESVSRSPENVARVFVRRSDGICLKVPLRATSLSTLVDLTPRAKLSRQSAQEFLELVKEYDLCPPVNKNASNRRKPSKSGRRSKKKNVKKS